MKSIAIRFTGLAVLTLVGSSAYAQSESKPAPAAPGKAPPAEMAPAKPDPALQAYKEMIGTWKCEGKMNMGGGEVAMKSTAKFSWDVDNFWVMGKFDSVKTKGMPQFKGVAYYGYDAANKTFVSFSVDNMGGWGTATSKGRQGDKEEWVGKAKMGGKELDTKTVITRKSEKEVQISDSMGGGGMTSEMTCKK